MNKTIDFHISLSMKDLKDFTVGITVPHVITCHLKRLRAILCQVMGSQTVRV